MENRDQSGNALRRFHAAIVPFLFAAVCSLLFPWSGYAQQELTRATPPSGRALVFVYRVDRDPVAAQVPVSVNREPVGELTNGTFVAATVNPGRTELRIGQRLVRTITFTAAANQSYFLRIQVLDGRTPVRFEVESVSEAEGRRAIGQSRLVGVAPAVVIPPVVVTPPTVTPPIAAQPAPPPIAAPAATPPAELAAPVTPAPVAAPTAPAEPPVSRPAATPQVSAPAEPHRESKFALIAKAGTFKLANENQTVAGFPSTFDTTSSSVYGVEAEWRSRSGFALGGEYFTYKNDLVSTATNPNAQQKVYAVMLNGKYYFRAAEWFYPFIGAGVGQASASYSGGLTGNATGLAYQGLAGVEFRFSSVGVSAQYKHFSSKTGDGGREVKVDGSGFFGGVSISF